MRFLLCLCLALFANFSFGQNYFSIPKISPVSVDISLRVVSSGDPAQGVTRAEEAPAAIVLPDAPSPTPPSGCPPKGKPCPRWLQKVVGPYPPENQREPWDGRPDHFFSIGSGNRMLHPDRKSWAWFAIAEAGMWAADVAAVRHYPASKQAATSAYPAAVALTGMDFLVFKGLSPVASLAPAAAAIVVYSRAALE